MKIVILIIIILFTCFIGSRDELKRLNQSYAFLNVNYIIIDNHLNDLACDHLNEKT